MFFTATSNWGLFPKYFWAKYDDAKTRFHPGEVTTSLAMLVMFLHEPALRNDLLIR